MPERSRWLEKLEERVGEYNIKNWKHSTQKAKSSHQIHRRVNWADGWHKSKQQCVLGKMLNTLRHRWNATVNFPEVPACPSQHNIIKKAWRFSWGWGKDDSLHAAGGNVSLYSCCAQHNGASQTKRREHLTQLHPYRERPEGLLV